MTTAETVEFSRELTAGAEALGATAGARFAAVCAARGVVAGETDPVPLVPAWPEAVTCVEGVETFACTVAEPLELTVVLTAADAVGVETLPETCVPLAEAPAFACADTVGVEAVAVPETAAGAVWAAAVAEAEADGVETLALTFADG